MKSSYKLPYSIDVNEMLDQPVSLRFAVFGIKVPVPVYMILMVTFVVISYGLIVAYLFKIGFGLISAIFFSAGYIPICIMMLKKNNTGDRGYKWLYPTLMYYPTYEARKINTRSTANNEEVDKLQAIIPVKDIDESGMVEYIDNSVGVVVKVIGNGSTTLFEKDKESVVDSFESFLRDLKMNVSVNVEMRNGNQKCSSQIDNLDKAKENTSNATRISIIERKRKALEIIERTFTTIEYRIFLRSKTSEDLQGVIKAINSKRASNQMFKSVEIIKGEEVYDAYREFYSFE